MHWRPHFAINGGGSLNSAQPGAPVDKTARVLGELLEQTIYLRDFYKWARRQTTDHKYRLVYALFTEHYADQVRLVDVLLERLRRISVEGAVSAGHFLRNVPFPHALAGSGGLCRLLEELLDAHEEILMTANSAGGARAPDWVHDFAVGQVVLTTDLQRTALRQLIRGIIVGPGCREVAFQGEDHE